MVEATFHAVYGIELVDCLHTRSWKWFFARLRYLMASDTPLRAHFAPRPEPPDTSDTFDPLMGAIDA